MTPTNEWNTFGPIGGLPRLINCTRRAVEWFAASIGHPKIGPLSAWATGDGMAANLIISEVTKYSDQHLDMTGIYLPYHAIDFILREQVTFRAKLQVESLEMMGGALPPSVEPVFIAYSNDSSAVQPSVANLTALGAASLTLSLQRGGWFGLWSTTPAAAHLYFNTGPTDLLIKVMAPSTGTQWFRIFAPYPSGQEVPCLSLSLARLRALLDQLLSTCIMFCALS